MHFIGSILSSVSGHGDGRRARAHRRSAAADDPDAAGRGAASHGEAVTTRSSPPSSSACWCAPATPRARSCGPHHAWADVFESVVLDRPVVTGETRESRFDDNYAFFRSQISPREAPARLARVCRSSSTSRSRWAPGANAQQIFESLNSTGEPLRDHELIHNYVLMGLSHAEQNEIEQSLLGADRAEHRRGDRAVLAALPRHAHRPRGARGRRARRVRGVPCGVPPPRAR